MVREARSWVMEARSWVMEARSWAMYLGYVPGLCTLLYTTWAIHPAIHHPVGTSCPVHLLPTAPRGE